MVQSPLQIHRCPNCAAKLKQSHISDGYCWKCEYRFSHDSIKRDTGGIRAKSKLNNKIENDQDDKKHYPILIIILGISIYIFWMIKSYPDMDWGLNDSESKKNFALGCLQVILVLLIIYLWKKIKKSFSYMSSSIKYLLNKKLDNRTIHKNNQTGHISNRLKELKNLYEDNLIDEGDYMKKKEELLKEL